MKARQTKKARLLFSNEKTGRHILQSIREGASQITLNGKVVNLKKL